MKCQSCSSVATVHLTNIVDGQKKDVHLCRQCAEEQQLLKQQELNLPAIRGHLPDRPFLLLVDPAESARRVGENGDRIEREGEDFRRKVDEAYRLLAQTFPQRIEPVDGSRSAPDIAKLIFGLVRHDL